MRYASSNTNIEPGEMLIIQYKYGTSSKSSSNTNTEPCVEQSQVSNIQRSCNHAAPASSSRTRAPLSSSNLLMRMNLELWYLALMATSLPVPAWRTSRAILHMSGFSWDSVYLLWYIRVAVWTHNRATIQYNTYICPALSVCLSVCVCIWNARRHARGACPKLQRHKYN